MFSNNSARYGAQKLINTTISSYSYTARQLTAVATFLPFDWRTLCVVDRSPMCDTGGAGSLVNVDVRDDVTSLCVVRGVDVVGM